MTWRELAEAATQTLRSAGIDNAEVESRWLVEESSGISPSALLGSEGLELATVRRLGDFDAMVARRCQGEPLQYVLGRWPFRSLDLIVDRRVLIPRPETESVVTVALDAIDALEVSSPTVVDLGTGSGAIGLSIAVERTSATVWATDASPDAIAVARANLTGVGRAATRVTLCVGSWFDALPSELAGTIDAVVTNPPYVPETEKLPQQVAEWEPSSALFSGNDGLSDIAHIIERAPEWLSRKGVLIIEMGPDQVDTVHAMLAQPVWASITSFSDLSGKQRGIVAQRSAE